MESSTVVKSNVKQRCVNVSFATPTPHAFELSMSRYGGKADIPDACSNVC
jgi:hypothetical protein